ncbi:MAG: sulfatase [Paludibacter sp.]|nr:sulfatase [Paludibacter sp.]
MMKNTVVFFLILFISIQDFIAQIRDKKKPNIIVYLADDASIDFGCYGNKYVKTPNIDKLASKGVLFKNAFVSSPQSSPSRISMMTGQFAHTLGVEDLHSPIDENTKMLPAYLKEVGYYTGCMLKSHWGDLGTKQFDFAYDKRKDRQNLYYESFMTSENRFFKLYQSFLDQAGDKPFFMWVGFIDPHRPYKEPETRNVHSPDQVQLYPALIDGPGAREDIVDYYDEIHRLDQHVGFMTAELERRGELDNTVIIFLSDNGMPFLRAKAFLYDLGIQIPLIVSWPGKTKQGVVHDNGLVSGVDIAPTILDIAGIKTPDYMYGKSIVPMLLDHKARGRDVIFSERNWHDTEEYARCIRTEKFKLIYNAFPNTPSANTGDMRSSPAWYELLAAKRAGKLNEAQSQLFLFPRPMIELYDIEKDPFEHNNLAETAEYHQTALDLLKQLFAWQKETNDSKPGDKMQDDIIDRITGVPISPILIR